MFDWQKVSSEKGSFACASFFFSFFFSGWEKEQLRSRLHFVIFNATGIAVSLFSCPSQFGPFTFRIPRRQPIPHRHQQAVALPARGDPP